MTTPTFCFFKHTSTMKSYYDDMIPGEIRKSDVVTLRGIVSIKEDVSHDHKTYILVDKKTGDNEVKVIFSAKRHEDDIEFEDLHDDVEVDDLVSVKGFPGLSRQGTMCIWGSTINVLEYGNNHYVDEEGDYESDEEDEDYVPSESEYESETDEEEEEEEKPKQKIVDEISSKELFLQPEFTFKDIPLRVFRDYVIYQDVVLRITAVDTTVPFQVKIHTKVANFTVSKLDDKYIGVFVPKNDLEPDRKGYDLIVKKRFSKLLKILM